MIIPNQIFEFEKVHFFDDESEYSKGIEYYHNLMPETSADEVTYEKTPKYMVIPEVPGIIIIPYYHTNQIMTH